VVAAAPGAGIADFGGEFLRAGLSFNLPSGDGVTLISKDWPSSKMEKMLGAISTASTGTGRPSSVTRQLEPLAFEFDHAFFFSGTGPSWTSYSWQASSARADFLVSSETAGCGAAKGEECLSTGSPARLRRQCGGIGNGATGWFSSSAARRSATTEQFVQPFGVDLAAEKIWFP